MITNKNLWLVVALCLGILLAVFLIPWATLLATVAMLQKQVHILLTEHVSQVENSPWQYGSGLILISFLYGVFHAVGPGHGKAIIISYLGTQNQEQMSHGIRLSFLAALLQAVVAIVLVTVTAQLLDLSMGSARKYSHYLELASYILVVLLGGLICLRAMRKLHTLHLSNSRHMHQHVSGSDHACKCQHHYVPETTDDNRQRGLVVLSMGLRPCTGAMLVLMYAYVVDVYIFGVMATLVMGMGTGLAVALLAVTTVYFRTRLLKWVALQDDKDHLLVRFLFAGLMLAGGILLLLLGGALLMVTDVVPVSHPLL